MFKLLFLILVISTLSVNATHDINIATYTIETDEDKLFIMNRLLHPRGCIADCSCQHDDQYIKQIYENSCPTTDIYYCVDWFDPAIRRIGLEYEALKIFSKTVIDNIENSKEQNVNLDIDFTYNQYIEQREASQQFY